LNLKDNQNRYRTSSLFWETRHSDEVRFPPLYTIKEHPYTVDGVTYPSLKQVYLSYDHIPGYEYEFALATFGSWEHWLKLSTESTYVKLIKGWREELEIRNKATAIRNIIASSKDSTPTGLQASRYLADKGYEVKRGRPSKGDIERERKIQAGVSKDLENDFERLQLTVIKGNK